MLSSSGVALMSKFHIISIILIGLRLLTVGVSRIEFPALDFVAGAFDAASTEDISDSCGELLPLAPQSEGGDGRVRGTYACVSEDEDANEDTSSNTSGGGTGVDDDDENSASGVALNTALFGLVAVAAIASAL